MDNDKLKMRTPDITEENFRKLRELFPNAVTETLGADGKPARAIDADVLRQEISATVVEGKDERYQFTWPGKAKSVVLACAPISKTLRLDRAKSVGRDGTAGSIDTENVYIEGDNLAALKILQETYLGKVKVIYIDPPYNTGNDFIYRDDFVKDEDEYLEESGQLDDEGGRLVQNMESSGRFHTNWLNMIYPRLRLARDLLSNDGVIFISIDDNEQASLKLLCDSIFGASNFIGTLIHQRAKGGGQAKYIVKGHDYIHVYARKISEAHLSIKKKVELTYNVKEINRKLYIKNDDVIRKVFGKYDKSMDRRCAYEEILQYKGEKKKAEIDAKLASGEYFLEEKDGRHIICKYEPVEEARAKLYSIIKVLSEEGKYDLEELGLTVFNYPKPLELMEVLCDITNDPDALVLDFFSGSATTAHAVMQLNAQDGGHRRFIMVQLPEACAEGSEAQKAGFSTICDIGEERIRRAGKQIRNLSLTRQEHAGKEGVERLDTGFRVFRVDSSNMKDVYFTPEEYTQECLESLVDNIKEDRTPEDLLFQAMLELGIELSADIAEEEIAGKRVFFVRSGALAACFDVDIKEKTLTEIAKRKPLFAVFRDRGMADDNAFVNFEQIFKAYSPGTKRRIL